MRSLTLIQNSVIDGLEGGDISRDSNQSSRFGTPDTPPNRTPSPNLDDEIDTLPSVQLLSFLIPSINLGVVDSLDGVDVLVPDEGF